MSLIGDISKFRAEKLWGVDPFYHTAVPPGLLFFRLQVTDYPYFIVISLIQSVMVFSTSGDIVSSMVPYSPGSPVSQL